MDGRRHATTAGTARQSTEGTAHRGAATRAFGFALCIAACAALLAALLALPVRVQAEEANAANDIGFAAASVTRGGVDVAGQEVSPGDVLTYTINWKNVATAQADENSPAEPVAAKLSISADLPVGATLVERSATGDPMYGIDPETGAPSLTWDQEVAAGASGSFSFQATVDEGEAGSALMLWSTAGLTYTDRTVETNIHNYPSVTVYLASDGEPSDPETPGTPETPAYTPLTIEDVSSFMRGTVTTTGRDALPGEELPYGALPADEFTATAVIEGQLDLANFEDSTSVFGMEDGVARDVVFHGGMTFYAPGTYVFNIGISTDTLNRLGGMMYDEHVGTVTIRVFDSTGNGTLDYEVIRGAGESAPDFTNSYVAGMGTNPVTVMGTVTLDGAAPVDGAFQFAISGPGVAEGTVASNVGSDFSFHLYLTQSAANPLFTDAAVRDEDNGRSETFTYTVTQVDGGTEQDGVYRDGASFNIYLTLRDDGLGTVTCTDFAYGESGIDAPAFANTTAAEQPQVARALTTFDGTVTLDGRAAAAGEFLFEVRETLEGETRVVTEGRNYEAADGAAAAIDFNGLMLEGPAVYDYTVVQVPGDAAGVTYDNRTFTVHVEVAYDETGTLRSTVTYPDGPIAFENTYTPTSGQTGGQGGASNNQTGTSSGQVPRTGDDTNLAAVVGIAVGGAVVVLVGVGILLRRRANR